MSTLPTAPITNIIDYNFLSNYNFLFQEVLLGISKQNIINSFNWICRSLKFKKTFLHQDSILLDPNQYLICLSLFFSTQPNILTLSCLVSRARILPVRFSSNHNFHNERWKVEAGWSKGEARATGSHGLFSRWTCSRSIPLTERLPGKPEPLYRRAKLGWRYVSPGCLDYLPAASPPFPDSLSLSPPPFSPLSASIFERGRDI